jgi:hypothetical protein
MNEKATAATKILLAKVKGNMGGRGFISGKLILISVKPKEVASAENPTWMISFRG